MERLVAAYGASSDGSGRTAGKSGVDAGTEGAAGAASSPDNNDSPGAGAGAGASAGAGDVGDGGDGGDGGGDGEGAGLSPADDARDASAGMWAGKGLGLLKDGRVPTGADAAKHALLELARGGLRGAALGGAAKGALALVLAIAKGKGTPAEMLKRSAGPDTLRFALFLGGFTGAFRLANAIATARLGRDSPVNAAVAGSLAGLTLLLDDRERRTMVALFLFSRSLDVLTKRLVRDGVLPYWKPFEALLFGVSNIPIMCGFLFEPDILQKGYYDWILWMGNVTDGGLHESLRERRNVFFESGARMPFRACSCGYHDGPCTPYCIKDWFLGLERAGRVYAIVHLLPLLLRPKSVLQDPQGAALKTATGFVSSCVFLTTYVFCVKSSNCFLRNLRQRDSMWHGAVGGLLTGLSTVFEKPSRVSELMLYCLPRAMEASWTYLEKHGKVRSVARFEVVFFSVAMAILSSGARSDFKPSYHRAACFVLGSSNNQ